jgi:hypothetical protein
MARGDFNENKDINRYLANQGRAPRSHLDWDTFRKVGQPGTYQAPPGGATQFRPTQAGVGSPNYTSATSNYNMFDGSVGQAIGNIAVKGLEKLAGRRGKDNDKIDSDSSGGSASSGNGTDMVDDGSMSGGAPRGSNRSQNASITTPSGSRGSRRSRRGDFGQMTQQYGIQMVQGNDNYGTVQGNMGGANVGSGDYDNSFQSKNSGGVQQSNVGNNNSGTQYFGGRNNGGGGNPTTPQTPPPGAPPGGGGTPPGGGGGTPPGGGGGTPPGTPTAIGGGTYPTPTRPPIKVGGPNNPGQPPALPPGPQRPMLPVGQGGGQGPSTYGNTDGVAGAQETKDIARQNKITELATGGATEGERDAAGTALNNIGLQSNVNPANQRAAGDQTPPMLAGYENMKEVAPQQNTRFGDMGMGIPANAPNGGGMPQQYSRMQGAVPAQYQAPGRTYDQSNTEMRSNNPSPFHGTGEAPAGLPAQYGAMQGALRMNPQNYNVGSKTGSPAPARPTQNQVAWPEGSQAAANNAPATAPAKKTGGRKATAPKSQAKTTEGPKSVSAKKEPAAKKAAGSKATAKPKEKK